MLLTERYSNKISGVVSCFDRVVIQGTLPDWCYNMGMTAFSAYAPDQDFRLSTSAFRRFQGL